MNNSDTQKFSNLGKTTDSKIKDIMLTVYDSLREKNYSPVNQIVGYILSGDPTYITGYNNSRSLLCRIDRDELLEELVSFYIANNK